MHPGKGLISHILTPITSSGYWGSRLVSDTQQRALVLPPLPPADSASTPDRLRSLPFLTFTPAGVPLLFSAPARTTSTSFLLFFIPISFVGSPLLPNNILKPLQLSETIVTIKTAASIWNHCNYLDPLCLSTVTFVSYQFDSF